MADWDKLNKELDKALSGITDSEFEAWVLGRKVNRGGGIKSNKSNTIFFLKKFISDTPKEELDAIIDSYRDFGCDSTADSVSYKSFEQLLYQAIEYGYEYHQATQFPELGFEDNMRGNALQWICNATKYSDFLLFTEEDMLDFAADQKNRGLEPTNETLTDWINYR